LNFTPLKATPALHPAEPVKNAIIAKPSEQQAFIAKIKALVSSDVAC